MDNPAATRAKEIRADELRQAKPSEFVLLCCDIVERLNPPLRRGGFADMSQPIEKE